MKVKISYKIVKEEIVDMSCTAYCNYRANLSLYPFPIGAYDYDIEIADEESEIELDEYFLMKKRNSRQESKWKEKRHFSGHY